MTSEQTSWKGIEEQIDNCERSMRDGRLEACLENLPSFTPSEAPPELHIRYARLALQLGQVDHSIKSLRHIVRKTPYLSEAFYIALSGFIALGQETVVASMFRLYPLTDPETLTLLYLALPARHWKLKQQIGERIRFTNGGRNALRLAEERRRAVIDGDREALSVAFDRTAGDTVPVSDLSWFAALASEFKTPQVARNNLNGLIADFPTVVELREAHVRTMLTAQQFEEAVSAARSHIDEVGEHWCLRRILACALRRSGALDEALSLFQELIEQNPSDMLAMRQANNINWRKLRIAAGLRHAIRSFSHSGETTETVIDLWMDLHLQNAGD